MKRIVKYILDKARRKIRPLSPPTAIPKHPKLLIFDFDGTIGDTFKSGFEILNQLSAEFGFRPLLDKEMETARDMTARQLMRYLGVSTARLPRISLRGVKLLHSQIDKIHPIQGMPEVLYKLRDQGISMGILTSNSEENVSAFLQRHHLEIFSFVRSSSRLFGKAREIKTILRSHKLKPEEILFVGDETRDVEAAHRTKTPIVAVDWGYNSRKALEAQHPQAIIDHPNNLLELLGIS